MHANDDSTNRRTLLAALFGGLVLLALLAWYRVSRPAVREHTSTVPRSTEQPRAVPQELHEWDGVALQLPSDGVGPLFHRRYRADIAHPKLSAEQLMRRVKANLRSFSPRTLADFRKTRGRRRHMAVGDEYLIKILGPWNGGVRVIDTTPTSFAFVTLEGHPEAGQIAFRAQPHSEQQGALRFEILSWARSRDMLVSLTYHEGKVGKEMQKNAWVEFCARVAKASGGELLGEITVLNEERPFVGEVVPRG